MCDSFHSVGKQPVLSEMLNKFVTDGAMFFATALSIGSLLRYHLVHLILRYQVFPDGTVFLL